MAAVALNVISAEPDSTLSGIADRCARTHPVSSFGELGGLLERQERDAGFATLDLIGHSTRGHRYLRIGRTSIDLLDPEVARFFAQLGASGILTRLGIGAVRLLGCETAVEIAGQRTIARLARVLGIPVFGTTKPLMKAHYGRDGFDPVFRRLLVDATSLPLPRRRLS